MIRWIEQNAEYWNRIYKPLVADVEAEDNDIVGEVVYNTRESMCPTFASEDEIVRIAFLLQRANEQNNVVCIRLSNRPNIKSIKLMEYFMLVLLKKYNVRYIRLHGRYGFITRKYTPVMQKSKYEFFCDLQEAEIELKKELQNEQYDEENF